MCKLQGRSLTAREQDIIKNGTPRQQAQKRAEQFLEDMCKRWRQESRDEYRLRFREELFNKRHDLKGRAKLILTMEEICDNLIGDKVKSYYRDC